MIGNTVCGVYTAPRGVWGHAPPSISEVASRALEGW